MYLLVHEYDLKCLTFYYKSQKIPCMDDMAVRE